MEFLNLQKRFYQTENSFNNFNGLSEENIQAFMERYNHRSEVLENKDGLRRYLNCIRAFLDIQVRSRYKTFDERMLGLIMEVDPHFVTYRLFRNLVVSSKTKINQAQTEEERQELIDAREQELAEYRRQTREALGFYDGKMLKYESILYKKLLDVYEKVARENYLPSFLNKTRIVRSFSSISPEKYDEIAKKTAEWNAATEGIGNAKLATYALVEQNNLLQLSNLKEQVLFFIMAVDPTLRMLTIYEEESRIPEVKRRITEEFGFMSDDLLRIERLYHSTFCPDKKISAWSL